MAIETIIHLLVPVSGFVGIITASIAGWLSLKEYRIKVHAETRLARSAELESDIKLLKLFTEIMDIAHSRRRSHVSEKAIEKILSPELIKELNIDHANINTFLQNAVITVPVGSAAQDSAISAIYVLGLRHKILLPVAIQALESLCKFKKEVAQVYLEDLKSRYDNKNLVASISHRYDKQQD
ncbi:hypothetical protein ACFLT9_14120 [Acidobacteriota bacterium]